MLVKLGRFVLFGAVSATTLLCSVQVRAATAPPKAVPGKPAAYATFVKGASIQNGLIPIISKNGALYFVLSKAQLNQSFIETSVPSSGLGGLGPSAGEPYVAPARIFKFQRFDDKVVLRWPNTFAIVKPGSSADRGVQQGFPSSIVAVEPIVAQDAANGNVVISASAFLGDIADYAATFQTDPKLKLQGYHLDPTRTFFSQTKAFPDNDLLRVEQTWASLTGTVIDNAPDARSLEVRMTYNIIAAPHDGYMPRIADPRIGYFELPLLNFASDRHDSRNIYYISRWNFAPAIPGRPSNATHPLVYYISNDIPVAYRATVTKALLTWNLPLEKIGILNGIQVKPQPTDPNWDPDDIRHNVVRFVDTTNPQYGAEALIVDDPRTGEEINVGINVDAIEGTAGNAYRFLIAPARGLPDTQSAQKAFTLMELRATVLHESGHDMGFQHNFIGSMAYTAKDLQSQAFTQKYGVASSVMEYSPINLWPKGTGNGTYEQIVLGPYDYYAIRYGYGYVPNAKTPRAELPTLNRWASKWANPLYRFASDEDAAFGVGHAIDPRVAMFDLTNHPLTWCAGQTKMMQSLMYRVNDRFPMPGHKYDQSRLAFMYPFRDDLRCATMGANTIGGEYLSRARKGDPGAAQPLTAVSRGQEYRAWTMLSRELFSNSAWNFNPRVLTTLTYSEVSSFTGGNWAYDPTPRHDIPVVEIVGTSQNAALNEMFAPLTLQRIDDLALKYRAGTTMSLPDLFNWAQATIYGDISNGRVAKSGVIKRNLQVSYAKRLAHLWTAPAPGTPSDAQALARLALVRLAASTQTALQARNLDQLTQAHLALLMALAKQALAAHAVMAAPLPAPM